MLDAQYGPTAAGMIRKSQLIEHPLRLVVNSDWDKQVDGELALLQHAEVEYVQNIVVVLALAGTTQQSDKNGALGIVVRELELFNRQVVT